MQESVYFEALLPLPPLPWLQFQSCQEAFSLLQLSAIAAAAAAAASKHDLQLSLPHFLPLPLLIPPPPPFRSYLRTYGAGVLHQKHVLFQIEYKQ